MESSGTLIPVSMHLPFSLWLLPSRLLVVQDRQTSAITFELARWRSKRGLSLLSQLPRCEQPFTVIWGAYITAWILFPESNTSHTWLLRSLGNRVYIPGHSCWKEGREDSCQLGSGPDVHRTWEGVVPGGISVLGTLFHFGWLLNFFILRNQQKNKQYF